MQNSTQSTFTRSLAVSAALSALLVSGVADARGKSQSCQSFSSTNAKVTATIAKTCVACSVNGATLSADGKPETAAKLLVNGSGGFQTLPGVSLRATAQRGIALPAGSKPGVLLRLPAEPAQAYSASLATLLSGKVQESDGGQYVLNIKYVGIGSPDRLISMETTKPFDALELTITNSQPDDAPVFEVFEFCSDLR